MELLTGQTEIFREKPTAVTLGKFDGIHRGHQKLIRSLFQAQGLERTVFTFVRPPKALVDGKKTKVLLTNQEKREQMEQLGVELLIEYPFTEQVCHMEPEAFVEQVLVKGLKVKKIIAGPDFGFGYQRRGNTELLAALAPKYGYELEVLEKERDSAGEVISSTRIREEIAAGRISRAKGLLGYEYTVTGAVCQPGNGAPPFLLPPSEKLLPPEGLYRAGIRLGEGRFPGRKPAGGTMAEGTTAGEMSVGTVRVFSLEGQKRIEAASDKKLFGGGAGTISVSFLEKLKAPV